MKAANPDVKAPAFVIKPGDTLQCPGARYAAPPALRQPGHSIVRYYNSIVLYCDHISAETAPVLEKNKWGLEDRAAAESVP